MSMLQNKAYSYPRKRQILIEAICILILIQIIFVKLMWNELFPVIKYVDEIISLIGLLYLIIHIRRLQNIRSFKYCISFLCAYIFLGLLSNINNDTLRLSAWVQIFLDLKIFAIIILIQQIGKHIDISKWGINFIKLIIIFNVPLLIFQFTNIALYNSVFDPSGISGVVPGLEFLPRGAGIFYHSSQLAVFTCFAIYLFLQLKLNLLWTVLGCLQLLSSLQRQEIFAFVVALILANMLFIAKRNKKMLVVYFLTAVVIFAIFCNVFFNVFSESLNDTFSLNFSESKDPRIVFFVEAIRLATETFPLGSGFGTFGGYSAYYFDSPLYMKLNLHFYHWYREGKWMTDTFYPHIIAESGYVGFICYIASIVCVFKYISDSMNNNAVKKACFFSCTYMLLCAVTSPVFNDCLSIVLCILISLILNNRKLPI